MYARRTKAVVLAATKLSWPAQIKEIIIKNKKLGDHQITRCVLVRECAFKTSFIPPASACARCRFQRKAHRGPKHPRWRSLVVYTALGRHPVQSVIWPGPLRSISICPSIELFVVYLCLPFPKIALISQIYRKADGWFNRSCILSQWQGEVCVLVPLLCQFVWLFSCF